jgi:hypothetical protein
MPVFGGPHGILLRANAIFNNTNLSPRTRYNQLAELVNLVQTEQPALHFDAHPVITEIRRMMRQLIAPFER